MKKIILLIGILTMSLHAGVTIDKDKFGTVRHVLYTGYVMDNSHALTIMNKLIGKRAWVKKGSVYQSGELFMTISTDKILITRSYELARTQENKYWAAKQASRAKPVYRKKSSSSGSLRIRVRKQRSA
jgi:hypothetical protein